MKLLDELDTLRLKTQQFPHDDALERHYVDELDCAYVRFSKALRLALEWLEAEDKFREFIDQLESSNWYPGKTDDGWDKLEQAREAFREAAKELM